MAQQNLSYLINRQNLIILPVFETSLFVFVSRDSPSYTILDNVYAVVWGLFSKAGAVQCERGIA